MWDGRERRKNNRDTQVLTKAILTANANFTGYHKDINYLKEGIDEIKTNAKDHTKEMKELTAKVADLPCNGQIEKIKGLKGRVDWLYFAFVIVVVVGIVLGLWMRNGIAK